MSEVQEGIKQPTVVLNMRRDFESKIMGCIHQEETTEQLCILPSSLLFTGYCVFLLRIYSVWYKPVIYFLTTSDAMLQK